MGWPIAATILNGFVILFAMLSIAGGGLCFGVIGLIAGAFNIFVIWKGMDADGSFNTMGLFANAILFVYGIVAIFQGFSSMDKGSEGQVVAGLAWMIAAACLSSGVVTMIARAKRHG